MSYKRILVKAVMGPSGLTGDGGAFVRVNAEDPEVYIAVADMVDLGAVITKWKKEAEKPKIGKYEAALLNCIADIEALFKR